MIVEKLLAAHALEAYSSPSIVQGCGERSPQDSDGRAASRAGRTLPKVDVESTHQMVLDESPPPGAWGPITRLARRARAPVERFLHIEAASGIVLLVVAAIALIWANSPWSDAYLHLWHTPIGLRIGSFRFERDLHFWINDALMTLFFFVVGLEIRREIYRGELSQLRRAALPLVAALGGMLLPALIYASVNWGRPTLAGWGVPMATDIAFAVGVLALFGKRVAPALRILLLALAVIDDVGAILVIALFYSGTIELLGLAVAALGALGVTAMQIVGVRSPWKYTVPGVVMWSGLYMAGVHPTLVGVVLGLMTPVQAWLGVERFLSRAVQSFERFRHTEVQDERAILPHLDELNVARREAVSPVERLQHALHGWVAFGIMPLFAFANAGVPLGQASFDGDALRVFLGIVVGLMFGKPIGIAGLSWLMGRVGVVSLPAGVGYSHVAFVGSVAGIGFTMSLFIAQLAFDPGVLLETAKLAIIAGSVGAAVLSALAGRVCLRAALPPDAAVTEAAAEASTER